MSSSPLQSLAACLCAAALFASSASQPAAAQSPQLIDLPLEQLGTLEVFSAAQFARQSIDVASTVSVVTAADIKTFGYRTLVDILRGMRGLHLANDKNYDYVGVRGFLWPSDYNTRVLILIDGQRVNDGVFEQGGIGYDFPVDVDLIERVEFVPGPGSAVFGSNAYLGVVHVTTRAPKPGGEARVSADNRGGKKLSVSLGRRFESGAGLTLAASAYGTRGEDVYFPEFDDAATGGVARGLDFERYKTVFIKYVDGGLALVAGGSWRRKGVPTADSGMVFNDPRTELHDDRAFLGLQYERTLAPKIDVIGSLAYGLYDYRGTYPMAAFPAPASEGVSQSRWVAGELRLFATRWEGHKWVAGLEFRRDVQGAARYVEGPVVYYDLDLKRRFMGLYLQDEIALTERWTAIVGARHDRSSDYGGITTPRAGLIFKPGVKTTLKAQYGGAYRNPNYGVAAERERIKTSEVSAEHFVHKDWKLTAAAFSYRTNKLLTFALDSATGEFVLGESSARAKGFELETETVYGDGTRLRASYSWQRVTDASGVQLARSPHGVGRLQYSRPVGWRDGRLGLEWIGSTHRMTWDGVRVPGYGVLNASLSSVRLWRGAELGIHLYNAFDQKVSDPAGEMNFDSLGRRLVSITQPGRTLRVQLGVEF